MNDEDCALGPLTEGCEAVACSLASGRTLLGRRDSFVLAQSPFDRQARVQVEASALEVTEGAYLSHVRCQVMEFTSSEIDALKAAISNMRTSIKACGFSLALPAILHFVKTSGREEGDAAYTRNTDTIVLPVSKLTGSSGGDALHPDSAAAAIEAIATHELFHVQSKFAPGVRERLYSAVGFQVMAEPVVLPDSPHPMGGTWRDWKITNPDAPVFDVVIHLTLDGAPDLPPRPMTPILMANAPYAGGLFFDYLDWGFLVLERQASGGFRVVVSTDGQPVIVPYADVQDGYKRKIGRNFSEETFHPDEILAQSFVRVMAEPDIALFVKLGESLRLASA